MTIPLSVINSDTSIIISTLLDFDLGPVFFILNNHYHFHRK